jgi:hypothetical protein
VAYAALSYRHVDVRSRQEVAFRQRRSIIDSIDSVGSFRFFTFVVFIGCDVVILE